MGVAGTPAGRLSATACLLVVALAAAPRVNASPKLFTEDEAAWIREHVGIYAWPPLDFPGYGYTIGQCADLASDLGTRIIRVIFEPERLGADNLVALAQTPDYRKLFDRFDVIVLTMPRWDPNEPEGFVRTEQAYDEFTRFLLREYSRTGKTFVLGFWEGDNAGMTGRPAVDWCNARHRGIEAARGAVDAEDIRVLEMIECNYDGVSRAPPQALFTAESCMARTVIPHTGADLYSFSAWMDLPPTPYRRLSAALDALAGRAPDSEAFGDRNVMLGEAGIREAQLSPDERFEAARRVIGEARAWGAPYVIWWWLSGREMGLVDPPIFGGGKSELWHSFQTAYHGKDEPFIIDDFDEPDLAPAGHLRNHLGGLHRVWSSHGDARIAATLERWTEGSALRVRPPAPLAPNERAEWRTELGCLDARGHRWLHVPATADARPQIGLRDSDGREAWQAWRENLPLARFARAGLDLSCLSRISIRLAPDSTRGVLIHCIAFSREQQSFKPPSPPAKRTISTVVRSLSVPELPIDGAGTVRRFVVSAAEQGEPILSPRLSAGGEELRLTERVPPGGTAWIEPGGAGELRLTAPFRRRRLSEFERCGLKLHNLRWEPEYHVFMATEPSEKCWLEMAVNAHHSITGGTFLLEGRKSGAAEWGVTVLRGDEPWEAESVATFQWVERELFRLPDNWPPSRWLRVRFWLRIERNDPNWQWDGTLGLVHARLDLDASSASPILASRDQPLVYSDREGDRASRLVTVSVQPAGGHGNQ